MKRIRFASCLLALLLSVLPLEMALGQEQSNIASLPKASANHSMDSEKTEDSYIANLAVDGSHLCLLLPIGFQLQQYELSDNEEYPFSYVYIDEGSNSQFIVYSTLDNEKDQGITLRKLYDKSNKNIIYEDVVIGAHTYIVHTKEQAAYDYGFYVQTDHGYSYHFQYILPYDAIQNDIPAEAISILSTLEIQGSSEQTK